MHSCVCVMPRATCACSAAQLGSPPPLCYPRRQQVSSAEWECLTPVASRFASRRQPAQQESCAALPWAACASYSARNEFPSSGRGTRSRERAALRKMALTRSGSAAGRSADRRWPEFWAELGEVEQIQCRTRLVRAHSC